MLKKSPKHLLPRLFFSLFILSSSASAVCNLGFDGSNQNQNHRSFAAVGFDGLSALGQAAYTAANNLPPTTEPTDPITAACAAGTEFDFAGQNYGCVTNPVTNKVWLDRNLGAGGVCSSARDDSNCRGDYYQWGRNSDGHEQRTSGTSSSAIPYTTTDNANFITGSEWASGDDDATNRQRRWADVGGNSICPLGFRVPTLIELNAELNSWGASSRNGAFASALKWPAAGYRQEGGSFIGIRGNSRIWGNSISGNDIPYIFFGGRSAEVRVDESSRTEGRSVRCVQTDVVADAAAAVIAAACADGTTDFQFENDDYRCVTNTKTNKVWLDRNLGAGKVCINRNEEACFGDLYQWGRNKDGHQNPTSGVSDTRISINANSANIIQTNFGDWASDDGDSSIRQTRWATPDGSGVCPIGFRVPTAAELFKERDSWSARSSIGAFGSVLKWPAAGRRDFVRITERSRLPNGFVWSGSPIGGNSAQSLFFQNDASNLSISQRADARSVRCIQN